MPENQCPEKSTAARNRPIPNPAVGNDALQICWVVDQLDDLSPLVDRMTAASRAPEGDLSATGRLELHDGIMSEPTRLGVRPGSDSTRTTAPSVRDPRQVCVVFERR